MNGPARKRTVILGAAGRDFHTFNMLFRDDPAREVRAFTAAQIPDIDGRRYPPALAGPLYPDGVPILAEPAFDGLCRDQAVDEVLLAYSDLAHDEVMHLASRALAAGADFRIAGPRATMLRAAVPVIAVSAVRTGCGKSQTCRHLSRDLRAAGRRVAVIRHPMPYGDLARQAVQRFATRADLDAADCTIEEREEYEPHIAAGAVVFAGVDYAAILAAAEAEADLLLWDGGNNDFPFLRPDLHIVLADALRPDQIATHHPGEAVLRMADIAVIAKAGGVDEKVLAGLERDIRARAPEATILRAESPVRLDDPAAVAGRRVLVVEDGPTITHGGMATGAGFAAARACPGTTIVDPRPFAVGALADAFARYPHIGPVLPAIGYGAAQRDALAATIAASDADIVVAATPADLATLLDLAKPVVRARYDYADLGTPRLTDLVAAFLAGDARA